MQVPVELKIKYLNRRTQDLLALKNTLEAGDYSMALKLGHQMKGNAVTFDFPQMAPLGFEIESAAKRGDKEKIRILAGRMEEIISRARKNFPSHEALPC
jgi:HPt (histidine-containing phosphotransfer) domain-containing protein